MSLLVHLFPSTTTPAVPSFGWFKELSQPQRQPVALKTALRQPFAFDPLPIIPSYGWFVPLSVPQRRDARDKNYAARASAGNLYTAPVFGSTVFATTITNYSPTFTKVLNYQISAFPPQQEAGPEENRLDKWFQPFTDPKRVAPRQLPAPPETFYDPLPLVSFGWFSPFRNPIRLTVQPKRNFAEFNPFPLPNASFGVALEFFQPLTNPKRFKPALKSSQLQFLAFDPFPIPKPVLLEWFSPWTDPKRFKPRLRTGSQQFLGFDAFPLPPPPPPDCFHLFPSIEQSAGLAPGIVAGGRLTTSTTLSGKLGGTITTSRTLRNAITKAASMKPTTEIC